MWFQKAAERGYSYAQFNLGTMCGAGRGVARDLVRAYMRYTLAVAGLSTSDSEFHAMAAKDRDDLAAKMTKAQIAEAQQLVREWKPK